MSDHPLSIAFVWHMHQPYYRDDLSGSCILPWVRMHGIKDYYDMPALLGDFPNIHQTFNLVPSLIKQIEDYVENGATDSFLLLSQKPAAELTNEDKLFLLRNFFMANWSTMIRPYPGYWRLLDRRGQSVSLNDLQSASRYFSTQDYRDLQVWFNLTWFDPFFKQNDPFLRDLVRKDSGFSEEEKQILLCKQREIMAMIIPEYRRLAEAGRIELTTTPFYHPILPLLCDTDLAKIATPDIRLPLKRFVHAEDAKVQVERALAYHEKFFGSRPRGMWPAEGSVADEIVPLLADAGIDWIATDEGVLSRSLGVPIERDFAGVMKNPGILYKPYLAGKGDKRVSIVFRDHTLSDLVGFVYSKWDYKNAVHDLIDRLHRVRKTLPAREPNLVSIILDGENAWEYYQNDGRDFFLYLYEKLSREQGLRCVTVGEYLRQHPAKDALERLHAGSWINANYRIWIGHEEDNRAWDLLAQTRDALADHAAGSGDGDGIAKAWEEIYIAEGSDWCWWYGDDHFSENDEEFDLLFRTHLMNVYRLIGQDVPDELRIPIIRKDRQAMPTVELTAFISPVIDGQVTNYFEWLAAGYYDVSHGGGAMHRGASIISHIYYGFDLKNFFLRLDPSQSLRDEKVADLAFFVNFLEPKGLDCEIRILPRENRVTAVLRRKENGDRKEIAIHTIAANDIIEMAVPFEHLGVKPDDEVHLFVTVERNGSEVEKWPYRGYIRFTVPTEDFEAMMWQV